MFRFDDSVREEMRQHWPVLVVGFSALFLGFSAPAFALPFLFKEVIAEFGWTREQATLLASAKYLTGAAAALFVGRFVDKLGVRNALLLTLGSGAVAMVSFIWVPNLTFYYLSGMLLGFSGPGAMVAVKVLVSRTFHAGQGTAMGIALLGTSLGSVVVPIVITELIQAFGWRYGIAAMSLGVWFVALPILFIGFFARRMKNTPPAPPATPEAAALAKLHGRQALSTLMKAPSFWLIAGAVYLAALVDQAFIQHQVLIFDDLHLSPETIALGVSAMGLIGIFCRVLVGNILDSTSNKGAAFLYILLTLASLAAFVLGDPTIFFAYIVLRAVGHAAVLLDTTVLTKHGFGLRNYGALVGVYTAFVSLGYATGPWLMGRLYEMSGSYNSSFALFAALPVVAAVLIWFMKPDYWVRPAKRGPAAAAGKEAV